MEMANAAVPVLTIIGALVGGFVAGREAASRRSSEIVRELREENKILRVEKAELRERVKRQEEQIDELQRDRDRMRADIADLWRAQRQTAARVDA